MEQERYARVPLSLIDPPSHQLREEIDPAKLGELADSMAAEGLHQPIGLRGPTADERFEVVWGHRRFLAACLLNWQDIPARVFTASYDPLLAAISENLQRADLTPLEEARAIEKLRAQGRPLVECARLFRRSAAWIRDRLDLLATPEDIQAAVGERRLPLAVAHALARIDYEKLRRAYIEEAERTGATAATVEVWVAHFLADRDRIIGNAETIEQIAASRGAFILYAECESCRGQVDFRSTRTWRFCATCSAEIEAAIRAPQTPGDLDHSRATGPPNRER